MNPRNTKKANDNLNANERKAMRTIRNWDSRIVRLQDKGCRFIVMEREEYKQKIRKNMAEEYSHKIVPQDPKNKHIDICFKMDPTLGLMKEKLMKQPTTL